MYTSGIKPTATIRANHLDFEYYQNYSNVSAFTTYDSRVQNIHGWNIKSQINAAATSAVYQ